MRSPDAADPDRPEIHPQHVAIVGMGLHVPGAHGVSAFWDNLRTVRETITPLDEADLRAAGESEAKLRDPHYVRAAARLEGFDRFDAGFFGISPREAAIMDPQHRRFLEVVWEALEDAALMPDRVNRRIGVFAGCGQNGYLFNHLLARPDLAEEPGAFLLRHTSNDKDFLATRVSHLLDLHGPSVNVQTACSTSLVAVHLACQSLLLGECDAAIAGGVTIELPQGRGYVHRPGEILSADGHCRAFDAQATGTVFGSGAGVVVLRRLADALADGDRIWAVIRASAVNNDGAQKASYLAPSVEGQARAVAEALALAETPPETIGFVECHGTGTPIGDPIEVAALARAFGEAGGAQAGDRPATLLGSVKANIGHLDTAAGVAALIKAALAVHHGEVPGTPGFSSPNPELGLEATPFAVSLRTEPWPAISGPRRACVNSLGVGGTNAHVVLEEPPAPPPAAAAPSWPFALLRLSAHEPSARDAAARNLVDFLRANPDLPLTDIAHTLHRREAGLGHGLAVAAASHDEAARLLEGADPARLVTARRIGARPDVVFMFPGGGAQYPAMASGLLQTEPVFAEWMERGLAHLRQAEGLDLSRLWPEPADADAIADHRHPSLQLPLVALVEIALARLAESWGIQPAALIGHSMGENVAAHLAGVMEFEDCLSLVALRGRLFETLPEGGMLAVPMAAAALEEHLGPELDIGAINAPELVTVAGPRAALGALRARLAQCGVEATDIPIDVAAHSRALDAILPQWRAHLAQMPLKAPRRPVISNLTGAPLTAAQATDPDYWVAQLRQTVRFADGVTHLAGVADRIYLEVGPGQTLGSLVRAGGQVPADAVASLLRHPEDAVDDTRFFIEALARLSIMGARPDWDQFFEPDCGARVVSLPTYPFADTRHFIAPPERAEAPAAAPLARRDDPAAWLEQPAWVAEAPACLHDAAGAPIHDGPPLVWLVLADRDGVAEPVIAALRAGGHRVITLTPADRYARRGPDAFVLAPELGRTGFDRLFAALAEDGALPDRIVSFWLAAHAPRPRPGTTAFDFHMEQGFGTLVRLLQAFSLAAPDRAVALYVFSRGALAAPGETCPFPEMAASLGPVLVTPREMPGAQALLVDLPTGRAAVRGGAAETAELLATLLAPPHSGVFALRGGKRLRRTLRPATPEAASPAPATAFRAGCAYLFTGGTGGVALALARAAVAAGARGVALVARRAPSPAAAAAIAQMRKAGAEVVLLPADVTDPEEMSRAWQQAIERFGAIDGVVHAAGAMADAPMAARPVEEMEAVLAPKLQGARVLAEVIADGAVSWIALCGSSSAFAAPPGQADYIAANAYLDSFAQSGRFAQTRVVAIDWGPWADTGMAARLTGGAETEGWAPVDHPLLAGMRCLADGAVQFRLALDPQRDWVLDEHRLADGTPVLPGSGIVDAMFGALEACGMDGHALADLAFRRPCIAEGDDAVELTLTLSPDEAGCRLELAMPARAGGRIGTLLLATARALPGRPPTADRNPHGPALPDTHTDFPLPAPQADHLRFGPRWQVLRRSAHSGDRAVAELALDPRFADELTAHPWHPGLADIATGWATVLVPGDDGAGLWVPAAIGRIDRIARWPARVISRVRLVEADPELATATFEVAISDAEGSPVARLSGFTVRRVEARAGLAAPAANAAEIRAPVAAAAGADPARRLSEESVRLGIRSGEAAEAFSRALASGAPQVVVSPVPLSALIARTDALATHRATPGATHSAARAREISPPRNAIEARLVELWRELLGVEAVSIDDDFFALGGHSLIAVRLFARIRAEFGADFPISALFAAPTIAAIAARIEAAGGQLADGAGTPAHPGTEGEGGGTQAAEPEFTHVVPMAGTEQAGGQTPMFMVAGMFGNVLNLRSLARAVGTDRPFYGLQARGLYGGQPPHRRIDAAAADMIAEMRRIQPHGPYLVGGFSGGGITAWEIARQLEAQGEPVALVAMLDTPLPRRKPLSARDRLLIQLAELRAGGPGYVLRWARNRLAWEIARRAAPGRTEDEAAFHDAEIEAAFLEAVAHYTPPRRDGPAVLFRPPLRGRWQVSGGAWVNSERAYVVADNGWSDFAPGLEVIEVPGDHDSMVLEPNVRVLARHLRAALARAEAAHRANLDLPEAAQ